MEPVMKTALLLLVLLQAKHLLADFFLQTRRMLMGRDEYLHVGRMQHAAVHAMLSVVVLLIMGAPLVFTLVICLIEWVVHFHIDWGKGWHSAKKQHTPTDAGYWHAFGVDQFLHQLTYVVMVWAWAVYAL